MHIKTQMRNLVELTRVAEIKWQTIPSVGADVEKSEPAPTPGMSTAQLLWKTDWWFFETLNTELPRAQTSQF